MKLSDIHIRDPFILPVAGTYYLYGSRMAGQGGFSFKGKGLDVYTSTDLVDWSDAHECFTRPEDFWADRDFWAPEVHTWRGAYYMFVSFKAEGVCRGTQILRSQSPMGPFVPISAGPVTPRDWECLDGTFYVDDAGCPWMVFCHEWVQIGTGTVCTIPLKEDLTASAGPAVTLFAANEPAWVVGINDQGDTVTDGPFLLRSRTGQLRMIWSSFTAGFNYAQALAVSESGAVTGPWRHAEKPLADKDSGHGMIFTAFDGQQYLVLHRPNNAPLERPCLLPVTETEDGYTVGDPIHG